MPNRTPTPKTHELHARSGSGQEAIGLSPIDRAESYLWVQTDCKPKPQPIRPLQGPRRPGRPRRYEACRRVRREST